MHVFALSFSTWVAELVFMHDQNALGLRQLLWAQSFEPTEVQHIAGEQAFGAQILARDRISKMQCSHTHPPFK